MAVAGATGGVGSTSLAVNLGCVLAADEANSVALVDLDLSLGDADVFLDTIPDYTIVDVVAEHRTARFPAAQAIDDQACIGPVPVASSRATAGHFAGHARRAAAGLRVAQSHILSRPDRLVESLQPDRHDGLGSGQPSAAGHAAGPALPAERRAVDDVVRSDGRAQGQDPDRRQPRRAGQRPDQPEEGEGDDRTRHLLAVSQRLPRHGRNAQQRRSLDRAGAASGDHPVDRRAGRRAVRPENPADGRWSRRAKDAGSISGARTRPRAGPRRPCQQARAPL